MRRFLPAAVIALLVLAVATPVNAGYLIIRILLENSGSSSTPGTGGTPTPPGAGGTGFPGIPGGPMQGSGFGPPGGLTGSGGGMKPPGGGTGGTPTTSTAGPGDPSRSLVVVIPITDDLTAKTPFYAGPVNQLTNPNRAHKIGFTHRGTKITTNLFADSSTVQWYEALLQTPKYRRTRATEIHDKHTLWLKSKTDTKTLYDLIVGSLANGMVDDAMAYADELLTTVGDKKDGLVPEVATFVRAYGAMQKGLKDLPAQRGKIEFWQAKLGTQNVAMSGHYAVLYHDTGSAEVQRRAAILEENFRAFYLAHALRGIELTVPDAPLIAVLPKRAADVFPLAKALDAPTAVPSDGFYSSDHDVLVLSPQRLDDLGQSFLRQTQQIYTEGVSRETLLAGQGPRIHTEGKKDERRPNEVVKRPDDVAWMQTMALVERFVDEDAAVFAASREGSRQLLHATGQLPRYVALPEWLSHGSVNFFARPRDPAFITNSDGKWMMSVSPTTGYGVANYNLQRYLRDFIEKKELHPDRGEVLKNVLTDAYFRGLRDPREVHDPDPEKEDKSGIALSTGGGTQPATGTGGTPMGGTGFPKPPGGTGMGGGSLGPPAGGGGSSLGPPAGGGGSSLGPPAGGGTTPPMGGTGGATTGGTPPAEDPIAKLRKKRERLGHKAQATAWALYYYLAKDRPAEFKKFQDELAAMPRDLPLDSDTIVAAFARAFNLDGSKESLRGFADKWLEYIGNVSQVGIDIPLVDPKPAPAGGGTGGTPGTGATGGTGYDPYGGGLPGPKN